MNSTTSIELARARAHAQRLASRLGLDPNPWSGAAEEYKAALEAKKQAEAAEAERRMANETELFSRALREHQTAQQQLVDARRSEADTQTQINQVSPDIHARLEPYRLFLTSQQGVLWKQYHDPENPPKQVGGIMPRCPDVPKGFTSWEEFLEVRELQRLLEQRARHGSAGYNALRMMADQEDDFPALKELRPEEAQK
jgi:multidrug efflux pump subunit AcrA (membrane-fusion protein)